MTRDKMVRTTRRSRGGAGLEQLKQIVEGRPLTPVIINPASRFVVVTYWWGRGNYNMNTARPCPDVRKEIIVDEGIDKYIPEDLLKSKPDATDQEIKDAINAELGAVCKANGIEWRDPIKYDEMVENWINRCKASNCNYLAAEYPEFAVKGGYQLAINAKPLFINQALKQCGGRGVLYIDGDMTINSYPKIFDTPNVDYMARAWDSDPRSSYLYKPLARMRPKEVARVINRRRNILRTQLHEQFGNTETVQAVLDELRNLSVRVEKENIGGEELARSNLNELVAAHPWMSKRIVLQSIVNIKKEQKYGTACYDPYVFQTSGGTMFFAYTPAAFALLHNWERLSSSALMAGKADDRVLSLLIQQKHLFTAVNFISLPIEYLWLTGNYETFMYDGNNFNQADVLIEHPECLTTEEAAGELGAASDRSPKFYGRIVESALTCNRGGGILYEKSYFDNAAAQREFAPFLNYMSGLHEPLLTVVPMGEQFGPKSALVERNHAAAATVDLGRLNTDNKLVTVSKISEALAALKAGRDAVYLPEGTALGPSYLKMYESPVHFELICVNNGEPEESVADVGPEYRPDISVADPIVFRSGNHQLVDLLSMCRGFDDITAVFNSGFMWLHRIRCAWVAPGPAASTAAKSNAAVTVRAERTLNSSPVGYNGRRSRGSTRRN